MRDLPTGTVAQLFSDIAGSTRQLAQLGDRYAMLLHMRNLRRNPRIAVCVGDERRSVSLYGTATIGEDQHVVRQDLEQLTARYTKEKAAPAPEVAYATVMVAAALSQA